MKYAEVNSKLKFCRLENYLSFLLDYLVDYVSDFLD